MIADQTSQLERIDLDHATAKRASLLSWEHRDPFDRFLAATALQSDLTLVSKDEAFDQLADIKRIWTSF